MVSCQLSSSNKGLHPTAHALRLKPALCIKLPTISRDFVAAIIEHFETLATHPDIGRIVPEFNDESIRELIYAPFRVVYLRESKSVKIIRVWRSERLLKLSEQRV